MKEGARPHHLTIGKHSFKLPEVLALFGFARVLRTVMRGLSIFTDFHSPNVSRLDLYVCTLLLEGPCFLRVSSMAPAAKVYPNGLFHLKHGYGLWMPEPLGYNRVSVGDVGYVDDDGMFVRLFNVLLPHDHASHTDLGVPSDFERLELRPTSLVTKWSYHNSEEPIRSDWVATSKINLSLGTT